MRIHFVPTLAFLLLVPSFMFAQAYDIIVAKDGSGNVSTVQAAFDLVPDNSTKTTTIYIKNGIYREKLHLTATKTHVVLLGQSKDNTVLTYDDYANKTGIGGTDYSYSTLIEANDFYASEITFQNTIDSRLAAYSNGGQAVALEVKGDRMIFYRCNFKGFQDTFYTKGTGRVYVSCCNIEGTTDFIFGAGVAIFNNCNLLIKKNSYFTAAANLSNKNKYNYVFMNCTLSDSAVSSAFLGRPWKAYAKVVYIRCIENAHINPAGWSDWSGASYDTSAYFAEYKCTGLGFNTASRLSWSHQLTDNEAALYTIPQIFAAKSSVPAFGADWVPVIANETANCTSVVTAVNTKSDLNNNFVFPNPVVNGTISFQLYLNKGSDIKIKMYQCQETSGRTLTAQYLPEGEHLFNFDVSEFPSGIYFYSIEATDRINSGKFMILNR